MARRTLRDPAHLLRRLDAIDRPAEGLGQRRREPARSRTEIEHGERARVRRIRGKRFDPPRQPLTRKRAAALILRVLALVVADLLQHEAGSGEAIALCAAAISN
jgi:hypothetical protein